MKTLTIGFLGCGGIGCGVWDLLKEMRDEIARREGLAVRVKRVLVRDPGRKRQSEIPEALLTADARDLLDDPEITVLMEFMGGEEPALSYLCRALEQGKTVVTANKMAVALGWERLQAAAGKGGGGLYFEAAVCGAIPIIRVLASSMQGNRVDSLMGIVNGTTNYILSQMADSGRAYREVLAEAQALGYAEADPASDVDGFDAAYKLAILSSLAFHQRVPFAAVKREGISRITQADISAARELGYAIKLLAVAREQDGAVEAGVHPALLPGAHPLAGVNGAFNAVLLHGSAAGEMMLYGRGAGSKPTAGALVGDLLYAARQASHHLPGLRPPAGQSAGQQAGHQRQAAFFLRFDVPGGPDAAEYLRRQLEARGLSVGKMLTADGEAGRPASLTILTGRCGEKALDQALAALDPSKARLEARLRVEGQEEAG